MSPRAETAPLVTCLCLTRNRRNWLPKAIECFEEQTYPSKELLIVVDGQNICDLIPENPAIRVMRVRENAGIAEKRNIGCRVAAADVIAHWDDDDYSGPERLGHQVPYLLESGAEVIAYSKLRFTDGKSWWRYRDAMYPHGTSLVYTKRWWRDHPFNEDMSIGEDVEFSWRARAEKKLGLLEAGEYMYATVHPGNSFSRGSMPAQVWEKI